MEGVTGRNKSFKDTDVYMISTTVPFYSQLLRRTVNYSYDL